MSKRLSFGKVQPAAYKAMEALDNYVDNSSLSLNMRDLIKLRTSQINGCAYCVDLHSYDLRKEGENEQRVWLVSAWKEAGDLYTPEERIVFQMTDEITLLHREGLREETYQQAVSLLGETKVAEVIMVIVNMNAWNRIGVSTHMTPAKRKI